MKYRTMLMACLLTFSVSVSSFADEQENETLGDVMYLLLDQFVGLGTFAKSATPGALEDKDFNRANHRVTGASYLFKLIAEKKGEIKEGVLVKGELTPSKFLTTPASELPAFIEKFDAALKLTSDAFVKIGEEIKLQKSKAPAERNFRSMKLAVAELEDAMKKAHEAFKPQHP